MKSRDELKEGELKIEQFLTHLAVHKKVAPSTQNQAMNALIFLYKKVLKQTLVQKIDAVRAKSRKNIPVVMTLEEVIKVISYERSFTVGRKISVWMRVEDYRSYSIVKEKIGKNLRNLTLCLYTSNGVTVNAKSLIEDHHILWSTKAELNDLLEDSGLRRLPDFD
jgi:hypothetical protein